MIEMAFANIFEQRSWRRQTRAVLQPTDIAAGVSAANPGDVIMQWASLANLRTCAACSNFAACITIAPPTRGWILRGAAPPENMEQMPTASESYLTA